MGNWPEAAMRWLESDFDYRYKQPEEHDGDIPIQELINQVQEAIGVGQPYAVPGEWPQLVRQLWEDSDFHFVGGKIFKKRDPIADAKDGNWGQDTEDMDSEEMLRKYGDNPNVRNWITQNFPNFKEEFEPEPNDALEHAAYGMNLDMCAMSPGDIYAQHGESEKAPVMLAEEQAQDADPDFELSLNMFELLDTVSLNSPFCPLGYRQPRDRYQFCAGNERQPMAEAADSRKRRYHDCLIELESCSSEMDLNRFMEQIREDYYRDKELKNLTGPKAMKEFRQIYFDSMHRQGLDQESIRRKLWAAFDRVESNTAAVFVNKKLMKPKRRMKPSIWQQSRSKDLMELVLTVDQWSKLYDRIRVRRTELRETLKVDGLEGLRRIIGNTANIHQLLDDVRQTVETFCRACRDIQARNEAWAYFGKKLKELQSIKAA